MQRWVLSLPQNINPQLAQLSRASFVLLMTFQGVGSNNLSYKDYHVVMTVDPLKLYYRNVLP